MAAWHATLKSEETKSELDVTKPPKPKYAGRRRVCQEQPLRAERMIRLVIHNSFALGQAVQATLFPYPTNGLNRTFSAPTPQRVCHSDRAAMRVLLLRAFWNVCLTIIFFMVWPSAHMYIYWCSAAVQSGFFEE